MQRIQHQAGFTLIEILIITGILGILSAISINSYTLYLDKVDIGIVKLHIGSISRKIEAYHADGGEYPEILDDISITMLDPWGNPYQYLNIATVKGNGKLRKDKNLVPINSDYDLYSMGKDGASVGPLTARASRDDIIRANNGAYVGLASEY